jgi:nuclear pore complex protein Nup160
MLADNTGSSTTPDEVVGLLVQRGSFDLALSTASSLNVDMTPLFQSLARRCVELSRMSDIARYVLSTAQFTKSGGLTISDLSSASFLHASPLTSRLRGSPSALALRYLQISLERHDSAKTNFKYRQIVANTLFEINTDKKSGWEMPRWLVHTEMERDAEAWIGRAIKYGWIGEAITWTRQILRDVRQILFFPCRC